jgi:tRNA(Ile)-lysidine synthetase, N-terminal domain/tRNA(Ile)-lysidine synthetase, C-terminal domain
MLSQVLHTIREQALLAGGERVLVAVSGGPDSTALLHALMHLASRLHIELVAATVDHGLRPESGREAALVAERCRALGVACEILVVDVKAARHAHVSWQEAARNVRLLALQEAAARLGCPRVALGHNADDQAETVLFRIVRGTGVSGLAGIPYERGVFIRPLLDVRRKGILAFLAKRRIPFIEDPSNANRHYARVRIRLDLLPLLARENPRVVEALLSLAQDARAIAAGTPIREPLALPSIPRRAAALIQRMAAEGRGTRRVSVPEGEVVVSYGNVRFRPRGGVRQDSCPPSAESVRVKGPGIYRLPGQSEGSALKLEEGRPPAVPPSGAAVFDATRIARPLEVRAWRPGERMRPRGGRGSRKVSDLLVDAKIPRDLRRELPVLVAADGNILFVPGLRPSEVGRPQVGTEHWLAVRSV